MICPYCDQEVKESVSICPHCLAHLNIEENNNSQLEKKNYKIYYIIIGILIISLLILIALIIFHFLPTKSKEPNDNPTTESTTTKSSVVSSQNVGIYAGRDSPTTINNMVLSSINDEENNIITPVDVIVTRFLSDEEINALIPQTGQTLIDGFIFKGVEYEVYFRDLDYLGDNTLNPVLNATLYDTYYLNDFFHLNGHYYKNEVVNFYNGPNLKNKEMATIQAIYQVPLDENYIICFGEKSGFLGCYND